MERACSVRKLMILFPKCFPRALESTTTSSMCPTLPQFLKNFFSINTLPVAMIFPEASSSITPITWSSPTALSSRNRFSKSLSETESQTLSCCSNSMKPLLLSEISNFRTPYFRSSMFSIFSCEIQTESQKRNKKTKTKTNCNHRGSEFFSRSYALFRRKHDS
ncbi:hypothetical protein V8G54_021984 [Vigna mungo]|uniref:Uncharacterized protein n=1 Tax=Vigna mungo TaxID=3915 RepID=A0AAQ3NH53_VIGMU